MEIKPEFAAMLRQLLPEQADAMCRAIEHTAPIVSVRVNATKGAVVPTGATRVPWCESGFYLDTRPSFTLDPLLHSGLYYVQDASSMFAHHVVRQLIDRPVRYLDLCAAPGGKTTAALSALPAGSLMVANEVMPDRARVLADNVARWGSPEAVVTCDTPAQVGRALPQFFDVVAADVPCSGEGMMRKDSVAAEQWSPALVEQCARRQRDILRDVWPSLRTGGLLLYSTCTFNRQENEQMVEHLMHEYGAEPVAIAIDRHWGVVGAIGSDVPAYRFLPHQARGEGLFVAVLRKTDGSQCTVGKQRRHSARPAATHRVDKGLAQRMAHWLVDGAAHRLTMQADQLTAFPAHHAEAMAELVRSLHVLSAGITLGTVKGNNCIPHWSLALSTSLDRSAVACCDVDYVTALAYLRGEAIGIDAPRGHVLVTHRHAPLGWANQLGHRANNLYPKWLRIINKQHPDHAPDVVGMLQ